MYLSIIIPMYNEEAHITGMLDKLLNVKMPKIITSIEYIIVDDASNDNSYEIVTNYIKNYPNIQVVKHEKNHGKGAGVRTGLKVAKGDTFIIQDSDLELSPNDIPRMIDVMTELDVGFVNGSRYLPGISRTLASYRRYLGNKFFSFLTSLLLDFRITDMACGYKLFNREIYENIELTENGFGFEAELMIKALKYKKNNIAEVPVQYFPRNAGEGKKLNNFDALKIFKTIFKYGVFKNTKKNNFIDSKKNVFSKFTIYFILLIIVSTSIHHHIWTKEKKVLYWDAISYYAYLPATFIYKDISLEFMQDYSGNHKFIFWPVKTETDKLCIKTSMGVSILQLPFFLVGHFYALNSNFDAGGYSQPYKLAMFICTLFWFIIGLIVLRKLLLKFFSDAVTTFTILIIGLGTNIYYYVIFEPIMSHQFNFTFFIFFIYLTISWYEKVTYIKSILLGIVIGMISLIRPTDSIIALFFVLYGVYKPKYIKKQINLFLENYKQLILIIFFAIIIWIPQMLYWKFISGHYLYFSYSNNEHFFWDNPHFIEGLFGYRKGWLVYTPVMIFSLIGIGFLKDKLNNFFLSIIVILPVSFYIIFSWWAWWYGGSFGMRPLIEFYSLLSIPIAAFTEWTLKQKKVKKIALLFFIIAFSMYNLFATSQYTHGAIHWDGMTKEAYWDSFGRIKPSKKFWSLVESPDYKAAKLGIDKPKE